MPKLCSVCREPQFQSPSGLVCKNGHGGAPTIETTNEHEGSMTTHIQTLLDSHVLAQDLLDEFVHDHATHLASSVNNNGLQAQLAFLQEQRGVTAEEVFQYLAEGTT